MRNFLQNLKTLTLVAVLMLGVSQAWGVGYAKLQLYSSPTTGGYVYANTVDQNNIGTKTSDDATTGKLYSETTTMYRYAKAKDGYEFRGWADSDGGTPSTNTSSVIVNVGTWWGTTTTNYWAIFSALPTYYFKAEATTNNSTYGNAYVTFTEANKLTATTATATTNCYGTHYNTASMTKTAYFHAVVNTGYVFKGWSTSTSEDDIFNTNTSITYNLESSSTSSTNPAEIHYYAIFGTKFAPQITGTASADKKVGDSYTADFSFVNTSTVTPSSSSTADFYFTISHELSTSVNNGTDVISYNPSTGVIQALNAGKATITFKNKSTATHEGKEESFVINVTKKTPTFSCGTSMKVDGNVSCSYTNTSAATPTASNTDNFYYVFTNNTPTGNTAGSDTPGAILTFSGNKVYGKNAGTGTITFYQKETYMYSQTNSGAINITVSKHDNTLYANNSTSYNPTMYTDKTLAVTLTASNTDYSGSPISVEQVNAADTSIAKYTYVQANHSGSVASRQFLASTTWRMTQPENYKYLAGENTFSVTVVKASEATDCYIAEDNSEQQWGTIDKSRTCSFDIRGAKCTFQAKRSPITVLGVDYTNNNYFHAEYSSDGSNWTQALTIDLPNTNEWRDFSFNLPSDARYVRFESTTGAMGYRHIRNVKIHRYTYLNVGTDNNSINGTLTINKKDAVSAIYPGEKGQQNTTIYWGIANGGDLKIKCDDSRFTFSQNTISNVDCKAGTTDIIVYFSDTIAGTVTATATVYNDVYNRTFTLKGVIEKAEQSITWHNDILRLGQSYNDVATANTLVTYESADESIIRVDEDADGHKTILTAVGTGTVEITATAEMTSFYAEKSDTKSIKVTDKQIQWINWNQSLFGLKLGDENVTMNAVAASDVEGCVSSRLIEYSSSDESVVKVVNNNQLQIIGIGTAIITAVQAGGFDIDGHDYERAETEKTVIVRDPNAPCESFAYQQGQEVKMDCGWNALNKQTKTSEIDFNGIIPATGTLRYKGEYRKVAINYYDGTMSVEQYIPGENWQPVTGGDLGKPAINEYKTANLTFDRRATKMRVKVTDGLGYHYFTDCQVTQARFIETTEPVDFHLNVGQQQNQVIYLSYSNITDGLSLTLAQGANSHFSVDKSYIDGSCGGAAKNVALTITYHPTTEETNAQDVLTITDGTTTWQVVLTGSASRVNRHIIWDHADETNVYTVHTETLSAEARTDLNESAGVVTFSFASTSTATGAISMENVLSFTSAGVANVVAYTTDDVRYNAAPNVTKVFNVSKTPTTISTLPELAAVTSGATVGEVELNGWQVTNTINGNVVEGTLAITSADLINVGTNTVTLTFTPDNTDMYVGCTGTTTIVVNKATAVATPSAANIVYGQKVNESQLSNEGTAGTWSWTDEKAEDVLAAGTYNDLAVHFTPTSGNYTELDATVSLTVEKAAATLSWTTAPNELAYNATGVVYEASSASDGDITYSIIAGGAYAHIDSESGELTIDEPGHEITIQAAQAEGTNYNAPASITVTVTIEAAPAPVGPNTFTNTLGDNDWEKPENWTNGVPSGTDPDVVISDSLVINEDVTVGGMTILPTGSVTIISGGTLTVNGESENLPEYGDLHVMNDGALALGVNADLQVRDFILDAKLGDSFNASASGQVKGFGTLDIKGDAYFKMSFDPSGAISFGWYDFVVPFEVNISDGIFRVENSGSITPMTSGVDFLVQSFSEAKCAAGQKAWSNFSGTMIPGQGYTITFNYQPGFDQNTFLFKKRAGAAIGGSNTYTAVRTFSGEESEQGWNVLGNGTLRHIELGENLKIQIFEHSSNSYKPFVATENTITVGTSFQVQVTDAQKTIVMNPATGKPILAPKYAGREIDEFHLTLTAEGEDRYTDRMWVSASEEATGSYVIGHDLLKKGTPTNAKVAQMWAINNDLRLCDIEMPMADDEAQCALGLFAPQAQTYTIAVDAAPEDATLYLTHNGRVIWSLSASPYTVDLAKGTTDGYGLRIVARHQAPQVATGMDELNGEQNGNRKVLIDNMMYIITPEGAMYSVTGERVK